MAKDHYDGFPTPGAALKMNPDGIPPALSPQQQWQIINRWRAELDATPQAGGDLTKAWELISPLYDLASKGGPLVGEELSRLADTPLGALFTLAYFGQYPPPELLIMLGLCFDRYIQHGGEVTLEEVFFGKPISRSGTYANRNALHGKTDRIKAKFVHNLSLGMSRIDAAAQVSDECGGKPSAESILRVTRGIKAIYPAQRED